MSDYVATAISPTLVPALTELCRARPADPVTWLANYLQEHKPPKPTKPPPLVPTVPQPSAVELLSMVHSGRKSCVDLVSERLARIEAVNPTLLACIEVRAEAALAQAKAVDDKVAAGVPLRRLEGLPIVVKCNIDVAGTLSTAATPALAAWRPLKTAPCVAPLLAAGAIVLAKTSMPELAIGMRAGSVLHGLCKNPFDEGRNAGGSSSGTAVAVAAGIVPCGLGSDTAGSLRIPSACTGGVGMRPSKGRWSGTGVVPVTNLRDTPGPMGATVSDVALLDAALHEEPTVGATHLAGARVVVPEDWLAEGPPLAPEARAALALATAAFERLGAQVRRPRHRHTSPRPPLPPRTPPRPPLLPLLPRRRLG